METVLPGDLIYLPPSYTTGDFVLRYPNCDSTAVYSTVVGRLVIDQENKRVSVQPHSRCARSFVPHPGQTVYCRVTKVNPRFAGVDIVGLATADSSSSTLIPASSSDIRYTKLPFALKATIRQQDMYSVEEREAAVVYECFRPMDLVRAQVIGTGDTSTGLLLSTGLSVDLGVVVAKSVHGAALWPVAWNEMMCSKTGSPEKRKVARPNQ